MKDKTVAVINADELLKWLRDMREKARHDRDETTSELARRRYQAYAGAFSEVILRVDFMKFLVEKPADTEEE